MSMVGAGLAGLSEGFGTALPEAFKDINRNRMDMTRANIAQKEEARASEEYAIKKPAMEAQAKEAQALSEETMQAHAKEQQRKNTVVDTSQIPQTPTMMAIRDYMRSQGFSQQGKPLTVGDLEAGLKHLESNPELAKPLYQKYAADAQAKVDAASAPIKVSSQKLAEVQAQLQDPKLDIATKQKLQGQAEKLQGEITAAQKELEPLQAQSQEVQQHLVIVDKHAAAMKYARDNEDTIRSMPPDVQKAVAMHLYSNDVAGATSVVDEYVKKSVGDAGKNMTTEQLTAKSLEEKLGRKPTATEIKDQLQKDKIEQAKANRAIIQNARNASSGDSFAGWDKDTKEFIFQQMRNGEKPDFGSGYTATRDRKEATKEYAEWSRAQGQTGYSATAETAQAKSLKKSLDTQQKSYGMMQGFAANLNAQVDRVKEISNKLSRTDARLINAPMRTLRQRVKGSAIENELDMYLTEISSEIGKLSTGSQASIAELSVATREKWEKIHDPNLSIKDLLQILEETKKSASLRQKSAAGAIETTKNQLGRVGGSSAPQSGGGSLSAQHNGNSVTVNGKEYPLNPDGTVTVNGKKYKVQ